MNEHSGPGLRVGEAVVRLLEDHGVELVFGIPGAHNIELYRGLHGRPIRHVLTRHEQGAGFAADGYARVTGRPGVCFLITGPGVSNAATALGQAWSDSVPLLAISSAAPRASLGRGYGVLHESRDQTLLSAGVTAWSVMAQSADDVAHAINRAFVGFRSGRPRPVHLSIPLDLLAEPVAAPWIASHAGTLPAPPASEIARAAVMVAQAQQPLIIAGGGAVGAAEAVRALAERAGAPVMTTVAGKGVIAASHPLSLGSFLCLPAGWEVAAAADCVVVVGSELSETDFWRERLPIAAPIIRIDCDPQVLHDPYPTAVALLGDARATVEALVARLGGPAAAPAAAPAPAAPVWNPPQTMAEVRAGLAPLQALHARVWDCIAAALPPEAVITADMTQIAYSGNYLAGREGPRRWLHPIGFGTLGYALPAGFGAALGQAAPVLAVLGDCGVLFTIAELATAVENIGERSLVVLVWNNAALGEIRDNMIDAAIHPVGVTAQNPDYIALGTAFGCITARPGTLADLAAALRAGCARPGVTLVELVPEAVR